MNHTKYILFDGVCNFCNFWVQFAIKRDKKNQIKFGALQSDAAKKLLEKHHISTTSISTVVFIDGDKAYTQSTAALQACRHLSGGWPLLYGLIIIPKFLRNGVYNWVAKNRYKFFGEKESCMIPTPAQRNRFI